MSERPDWDTTKYRPFFIAQLETEDVFSGHCLALLRRWNTPWIERQRQALRENSLNYESQRRDLSDQVGDYAVWRSNRTGATRPAPLPYKHLTALDKRQLDPDTRPANPFERRLADIDAAVANPQSIT